ncbi:hypothetical protein H5410_050439 [Solanum commersonii]|uniref:Uncharacterized protein n=1 Tax=Solanum commersonii TaxID=4109 RepID=A0A9J5WXL4_SOLCO|nr:hypothetical protein H5410_050439 [Solanum commersonii]
MDAASSVLCDKNVAPKSYVISSGGLRRDRGRPKKYCGEVIRQHKVQLQLSKDMILIGASGG